MGEKAGSLARPSLGAAVGKVSGREMADKGQRPPHLVAHLVVHQWASGSLQGGTFSIRSRCLFVPAKTRTLIRIGPKHCSTSGGSHVISRVGFAGGGGRGGWGLTLALKLMEASTPINTWAKANTIHTQVGADQELTPELRALETPTNNEAEDGSSAETLRISQKHVLGLFFFLAAY